MRAPIRPRLRPAATSSTFTGFGTGNPGATYGADTTGYSLGTAFKVTTGGLNLLKIRLYLNSNAGAVTSGAMGTLKAQVFSAADAAPGANAALLGADLSIDSGPTMDAWNTFTLGTPLALTSGTVYYAEVGFPNGRYCLISSYLASDVVVGPITFPANGSTQGTSGTVRNGAFTTTGAGVTLAAVTSGSGSWYGIDVEVGP